MKRELLGTAAALVITMGFAAADDERKTIASDKHTTLVVRATQQAMAQIKLARRALGSDDLDEAIAALKRSERTLKKVHDKPPTKVVLNEIDNALRALEADPGGEQPIDLSAISDVVRTRRTWLDPEVTDLVAQANNAADIGDHEGAAKSLQIAREKLVADVASLPTEDAYLRVLAAQRALANDDAARATKILEGIPAVANELRISAPLIAVRNKLESAAAAAASGRWERAASLVSAASEELDAVEDLAVDQPFADELAEIDDELDLIDEQLDQGGQPSARKLRELARRTRSIGGD